MDPTILAAIVGGLITGVPATWAVIVSNRNARKDAAESRQLARSEALQDQLNRIRAELAGENLPLRKQAIRDLRALTERVTPGRYTREDAEDVERLLGSEMALTASALEQRSREVQQYSEPMELVVFVVPDDEEGQP